MSTHDPVPAQPYGVPAPSPARSPLAVASLAVGIAAVALAAISTVTTFALIYSAEPSVIGAVQLVFGVVVLLVGLVAGVLGLVALASRPDNRHLAGIGVGISLAIVVSGIVGAVAAPLAQMLAR